MDRKGVEGGIWTIIYLIVGLIVLIAIAFFIYRGFNEPAKAATEKGKEFVANLNDLSLAQLRDEIKKNPRAVMEGYLNSCENENNLIACNQYLSICQKGENYENYGNKLNKNEINTLREHCSENGIDRVKNVVRAKEEGGAEELYIKYIEATNPDLRESYYQELSEKYPSSNVFLVLQLTKLSYEEFKSKERQVFVKLVKERDYGNLLRLGDIYNKKTDFRNKAIEAYTLIVNNGEYLDLISNALMGRAAISDNDPRGNYGSVYLRLQEDQELKQFFEENNLYGKLVEELEKERKMEKATLLDISFQVIYPTSDISDEVKEPKKLGLIKLGEVNEFSMPIQVIAKELTLEALNSFFRSLRLGVRINDFRNGNDILICDYVFDLEGGTQFYDLVNRKLIARDSGLYCNQFNVVLIDLEAFKSPPYPETGVVKFRIWWMSEKGAT